MSETISSRMVGLVAVYVRPVHCPESGTVLSFKPSKHHIIDNPSAMRFEAAGVLKVFPVVPRAASTRELYCKDHGT